MARLPIGSWIGNAAAVLTGAWGAVPHQAKDAGGSRQTAYDHAEKVEAAVRDAAGGGPSCEQLRQHVDHVFRPHSMPHLQRQVLSRELIDQREPHQRPIVTRPIVDEVPRPHMVLVLRSPPLQLTRPRTVTLRCSGLSQRPACPTFGYAQLPLAFPNRLPAACRTRQYSLQRLAENRLVQFRLGQQLLQPLGLLRLHPPVLVPPTMERLLTGLPGLADLADRLPGRQQGVAVPQLLDDLLRAVSLSSS